MGIDTISKEVKGKICLTTSVDDQTTLVTGSKEKIVSEVILLIDKWGSNSGGLIAADDGNYEAIGSTMAKSKIVMESYLKYGKYQ